MLKIEITDPYAMHAAELRHLAGFLTSIAEQRDAFVASGVAVPINPARIKATIRTTDPAIAIAPDDNPATGIETPSPASVFAAAETPVDPAAVFGGNANGAPSIAGVNPSSTVPAAPPAISTASTAPVPPVPTADNPGATVANPVPPAPPAPGVEVDSAGMPWDARIHASTKTKITSGKWKAKKGVEPAVVVAVEAELRQVMAIPSPNVPPAPVAGSPVVPVPVLPIAIPPAPPVVPESGNVPPPPPTVDTATVPAISTTTPSSAPVAVPPPPVVGATPDTPAVPNAAPLTFPQLVPLITERLKPTDGRLTQAKVTEVLTAHGLPSLPSLVQRPDLVQSVAVALGLV